ncbi:MAG: CARDB domain-containing protein [Pseudomonadota bacterium]|nr:CARDB domain-containing protein [Pseudomonadota bacterium]
MNICLFGTRANIRRYTVTGAFCLLAGSQLVSHAQAQESTGAKPSVYEPVAPRVIEERLDTMTTRALVPAWRTGDPVLVIEDLKEDVGITPEVEGPAVARAFAAPVAAPVPGVNFEGIPATGSLPPDTVGDVGPNHYVQTVNTALAIYDKSGNLLAGPTPINALWSGFGGPCETQNRGDPVVRYDHLADRWLVSQFALPGGNAGFHECIAISRTPDPVSGGWFLYDFPTMDSATGSFVFPDYPKIGVWPDGYYMGTQRGFPNGGLDVWVFERDKMLVGAPATAVQFSVPRPSLFLMPGDLDGPPPPAGTPNFFLRQVDGDRFGGRDRLEVFEFDVDWANPAASTVLQIADLPTAPFDSVLCSATLLGACIPQPGVSQKLETLTVWPMWRAQYRNFGTHEAMVTNHTVDANGNELAGIRWYELRRLPGGSWSIFQQSTYSPDTTHRWMGSIAMDRDNNIALGYSVSSNTVSPGIRYAGRLATDPPGTLPQPEATIIAGSGAQTHGSGRWGNYSSMDVDPTDDCTFWYTTEYYESTSQAGWKTRIASFRNPACGDEPPDDVAAYEYAAKIICGLQKDPKNMQLVRGFYGTAINIHNPNDGAAKFSKKLALTYPPDEQKPGKVIPIARHKLGSDEALEVDCMDVSREVFPDGFHSPYLKGFIVIQSSAPLDVAAVYTVAGLDREGSVTSASSIDVEQIRGRHKDKPGEQCPDLKVTDIGRPAVSCPGGGGTCVTKVRFTVGNAGPGNAGAFKVKAVLDPGQSVVIDEQIPGGLNAGATKTITVQSPPGGNCFDPDCTVTVTVDSNDDVEECDESNNRASETTPG